MSLITHQLTDEGDISMIKLERTKQTATATILVTLGCFCYCACGDSLSLRNYENDPNMAKAMEYDLGENPGDYDKADRVMAEKYYLAYLENVTEPFQRARVYDHLGALYATGSNPRKGEKSDYDKARYYFRKVLELEPHRIDWPTMRARTMLASMEQSTEARVRARLGAYEWIASIDEGKIRTQWLPLTPDNNVPTELQMAKISGVHKSLISTVQTNIMGGIKHLPDAEAEQYLLDIVHRFAGSKLDKLSREKLEERAISIPEPEVQKPTGGKVPQETANPAWAYWLLGGIIAGGVLTGVLLLKRKASSWRK